MKKKHLLKSVFAALMVLCLCTADLTPAAALVTQAQIDALKSEAKGLNPQKKELQKYIDQGYLSTYFDI